MVTQRVTFEVYMRLTDRKRLARLMAIQGVSSRQLAAAAGWKSHTYVLRLLSGKATTLDPEPAVRIARFLQVGTDDLFEAKVTTPSGQNGRAA